MMMAAPLLLRIRAIRLGPVGLLLRGPLLLATPGPGEAGASRPRCVWTSRGSAQGGERVLCPLQVGEAVLSFNSKTACKMGAGLGDWGLERREM
jgi:hypothetical protein